MQYTDIFNLRLPEDGDYYNVQDMNYNTAKIESALETLRSGTVITDDTDLNDLLEAGVYYLPQNRTYTNMPTGVINGWLMVFNNINSVKQVLFRRGSATTQGNIYMRLLDGDGNVIGDWTRVLTENDLGDIQNFSWSPNSDSVETALTALYNYAQSNYALKSMFDETVNVGRKANTTVGVKSFAFGGEVEASGGYSHAEGYNTTASGNYSHAEGDDTTASGYSSHAEGSDNVASGSFAHAEGSNTTASGGYSHAEGGDTTASGDFSHAEGNSNVASGSSTHAEGSYNVASGDYSHAGGYSSTAYNSCSFVNGYNVESPSHDSMTIGHHTGNYPNDAWAGSAVVHQGATNAPAFVIGAGTENAGGCCFIVDYKGNTRTSTTGALGGDYAEFFEWLDGNPNDEDRVGHFVTLDGEKIKYANAGDYILGVVSGMPAILGNNDVDSWTKKYITDEFNRRLDFEQTYTDEEGTEHTYTGWKVSDEYNPEQQYQSRKERKEWDAIGMLGVLSVYDDGTCQVNGFCDVANGGIATAGSTYRVIARISENIVKVIFR